jgi:hypothetical protein
MQHLIPVGKIVAIRIPIVYQFSTKTILIIVPVKVVTMERIVTCMNLFVKPIVQSMHSVDLMIPIYKRKRTNLIAFAHLVILDHVAI